MMKILKRIILVLGSILILWMIVAAFISGDCVYEKSITINAPSEKVWAADQYIKSNGPMEPME
ncbi:hypothetical protein [Chryseobacterium carnipullorum]|uniref:hypothetical protein n=1 Tax=Chryseobacterium carnipullorum TaxID=1124835 RepID=UPI001E2DEEEA|nr:hypothetical protein [Chryseobacterium carnipullorum]